jgi:ElaB/YqjD/DUF883 family membrane-anchored ribosome-binding protein
MDSLLLQLVIQLPVIALLVFTAILLRSLSQEKQNLSSAIREFEDRLAAGGPTANPEVGLALAAEMQKLSDRVESALADIESGSSEGEKTREYMANQKTALKEFGRVLSRTSEQTYGELQAIESRIRIIESSLKENGFELDDISEAA